MYEYIPPKKNQKAPRLIGLFFLGGILLLFLPSLLEIPFQSFFQLVGTGLLTGAIFLVTRYMTKTFLYRVEETEAGFDLTVTEIQNHKRQLTVCRISLSDIEEIVTVRNGDRGAVKAMNERLRREGRRAFHYYPELAPTEACYLMVDEPSGGLLAVVLTPDDTLLQIFRAHMRQAE